MKIFCITGSLSADLEYVASVLAQAGVAAPLPSHQHDGLTLARWQQQVLESANDDLIFQRAIANPGRLWEQLATSLFVENMVSPAWGWADINSLWLLDFWREFEPNIHFILVYSPPQCLLSAALSAQQTEDAELTSLLNDWQIRHQELMRFYQQHPQRCLFINANDCIAAPQALLDACALRWKLKPPATREFPSPPLASNSPPLPLFLAQQWLKHWHATDTTDTLQQFQSEVEGCIEALSIGDTDTPRAPNGATPLEAAISDFRQLVQQQAQQARTQEVAVSRKLQALSTELDDTKRLLEQERNLQRLSNFAGHSKRDHPRPRHAIASNAVVQVPQTESSKAASAKSAEIAEYRAQLDAMKQTIAQLHSQLAATRQEEATLLTQPINAVLHSATNLDFAAGMRAATAHLQQIQHTEREDAAHAKNHPPATELANDLARQLEEMRSQLLEARNTASDALADSELLKAQLNEAHIELDHYFQSWKEAQREIAELHARWQNMLAREPLYYEYQSLCIADSQFEDSVSYFHLFIDELTTAGRYIPLLQTRCELNQGVASFVFDSATDGACNALLHWPTDQHGKALSRVVVSAEEQETLAQFATNDWHLQLVLCKIVRDAILNHHLTEDSAGALFASQHHAMLLASLESLQLAMQEMPNVIRFDSVRLMSEQVGKDEEHIWLELGNVSYGGRAFENFEFRISCGNLSQKEFGNFPKLEFPALTGQAPFDNWFDESSDDFGDKLELRFAMPDTIDFAVWQRLSEHDQQFVTILIKQLPAMLQRLQQAKVALQRPWEDWQWVVQNLTLILQRQAGDGNSALDQQLPAFMLETAFELRTATNFKFAGNEVKPALAENDSTGAATATPTDDGAELETDIQLLLALELKSAKA